MHTGAHREAGLNVNKEAKIEESLKTKKKIQKLKSQNKVPKKAGDDARPSTGKGFSLREKSTSRVTTEIKRTSVTMG